MNEKHAIKMYKPQYKIASTTFKIPSVGREGEEVECVCGCSMCERPHNVCQHDLENLTAGSWVDCRVAPRLSVHLFPRLFSPALTGKGGEKNTEQQHYIASYYFLNAVNFCHHLFVRNANIMLIALHSCH